MESPFRGRTPEEQERNVRYARACLRDCLLRGEAPLASHLLYAQDGVLRDEAEGERVLGMEAGWEWTRVAEAVVVYGDLGLSAGMKEGVKRALECGRVVESRGLPEDAMALVMGSS